MNDEGQDLPLAYTSAGQIKLSEWPLVPGLDLVVSVKTDGMWKKEINRTEEQALG